MIAPDNPHRRWNALNGSWVVVSPQRTQRPWQGRVEEEVADRRAVAYDPECYLCPGNVRANGTVNPPYDGVHVFDNDFPALLSEGSDGAVAMAQAAIEPAQQEPLLRSAPAVGRCRVVCYSPHHHLQLSDLPQDNFRGVIDAWAREVRVLGRTHRWVQVFENRGEMMGCSNPHPHGQIWATDFLPEEVRREDEQQRAYYLQHGAVLLQHYARRELKSGERLVLATRHWLVVVPYWAIWPFETLLLPKKRPIPDFESMTAAERDDLAVALARLQKTYDRLFGVPFPYSMGWHYAPPDSDARGWCLHAHFNPPLLRGANVRKFMVGFEMFCEPQRDLTPENAARQLRAVSS